MNWTDFWENLFYTSIIVLVFIVIGIAIMQYGYYKNLKKKKQFYAKLHSEIKPGVKVTFGNGLYGVIRRLEEETADIEVKSGAVITVSRYVIASIVE